MKNLRLALMGTPEFAADIFEKIILDSWNVVALISQPDKKVGRKQLIEETPVKRLAKKYGLPIFQPVKIRNDYQFFKDLNIDVLITCAYGQIVPEELLKMAKIKAINIHGSLLPLLRGASPIHYALINGFSHTGITIMEMIKEMDAGRMFAKKSIAIEKSDNVITLAEKLKQISVPLLLETLPGIIDGSNLGEVQNPQEVTFAPLIKKEHAVIDFTKTSLEIFNFVRGLAYWPTAYTGLDGSIMKIFAVEIVDNIQGIPGQIVSVVKEGFVVKTGDGAVLVKKLQMPGKNIISGSDFVNGNKALIGKDLYVTEIN